jgi:hypothetical protein
MVSISFSTSELLTSRTQKEPVNSAQGVSLDDREQIVAQKAEN